MALFLTQEDLDASLNEAQLILRSGARTAGFISPQSKQRAVDLLEEIVEACDNATAAPMLRTQNVAKYELAGTLQEAGYDVEARAMYLDAIDGFSAHDDCRVEAVDAKMAYGLLLIPMRTRWRRPSHFSKKRTPRTPATSARTTRARCGRV